METVIETEGLTKQYGDVTAVEKLSLRVAKGEIYAFLGLNGAGKTTTIRMLLGMIKPTSGSAVVLGSPIRTSHTPPWHAVGHLVETPHAYPELTVRQNLEVMRRLRPGIKPQAISDIIERLKLTAYADRRAGTLSLGNSQRLGLAKALLPNPKLLILDEPANGLDPAGIVEIRTLLKTLAHQHGTTIFMSSHILGEVSRLADRIGIIHHGRLIKELAASEIHQNRQHQLLIRTRDLQKAFAVLTKAGFSAQISPDGNLAVNDPIAIERPDEIAVRLVNANVPPLMLKIEQEEFEHYFLRLVGEDGAESQ